MVHQWRGMSIVHHSGDTAESLLSGGVAEAKRINAARAFEVAKQRHLEDLRRSGDAFQAGIDIGKAEAAGLSYEDYITAERAAGVQTMEVKFDTKFYQANVVNLVSTDATKNLKSVNFGGVKFPIRPEAMPEIAHSTTNPANKLVRSVLLPTGQQMPALLKKASDGAFSILADVTSELESITKSLQSSLPNLNDSIGSLVTDLTGFGFIESFLSEVTSIFKSSGINTSIMGVKGSLANVKDVITSPMKRVLEFTAGGGDAGAPQVPSSPGLPGMDSSLFSSILTRMKNFSLTASPKIAEISGDLVTSALSPLKNKVNAIKALF